MPFPRQKCEGYPARGRSLRECLRSGAPATLFPHDSHGKSCMVHFVNHQTSDEQFKIKKSPPERKIVVSHCRRSGHQSSQVRFSFLGEPVPRGASASAEKQHGSLDTDLSDDGAGGGAFRSCRFVQCRRTRKLRRAVSCSRPPSFWRLAPLPSPPESSANFDPPPVDPRAGEEHRAGLEESLCSAGGPAGTSSTLKPTIRGVAAAQDSFHRGRRPSPRLHA